MQVACKTLGFTTGGQIIVGEASPFPAPGSSTILIRNIICQGTEMAIEDCVVRDLYFDDYIDEDIFTDPVALVCTTGTGKTPNMF